MENYTSEQIQTEFNNLTKDKKIEVFNGALSIMQQYNGRSKFLCIAMAMGYENWEGENNTYTKTK
tara:strand:+ start:2958 stop:3152 length:195 start_codon:yes stop_codon:yes gene_type:complete